MKRYGLRLWLANALIVVALVALFVFLTGRFVPSAASAAGALLPVLALVVSACALLFAVAEGAFLYREWVSASRRNGPSN